MNVHAGIVRCCLGAAALTSCGVLWPVHAGEIGKAGEKSVASLTIDAPVGAAAGIRQPQGSSLVQLPGVPVPGLPQAPVGLGAGLPRASVLPRVSALSPAEPAPAEVGKSDPVPRVPDAAPVQAAPARPAAVAEQSQAADDASKEALKQALAGFTKTETPGLRQYRSANSALRGQRQAIAEFYGLRDGAPLWVAQGQWSAAARHVIDVLAHADEDGLDLSAYPVPASPGAGAAERAAADLALSDAVATYAFQASGGRVDPAQVAELIGDKPVVVGAGQALIDVAIAADPAAVLRAYNPPQPGYAALRQKLGDMLREQAPVARTRIPAGPPLKVGMRDPRVSLIRARFGIDAAAPAAASDALVYDTVVATADPGCQRANGLPASGVLTTRTIAALSGGRPEVLEGDIIANMERWRWMPRDMGDDRVEVNVPDYSLQLFHGTGVVHRARVIVGKPTTPTPIFSNVMRYVTVNPSWYVPQSIIKKEMLPHLANDPDYLARQGYDVVRHGDTLSVRQPPGDRNALGHIVFWFPNDYAVYLHDTPSRSMFGNDKRAMSHGCVRLDQPFKFAALAMGADKGWTEDKLRSMIGSSERYIAMPQPLPIHIMYFTAFVDGADKLQLRDDVYGYSAKVKAALGLQG